MNSDPQMYDYGRPKTARSALADALGTAFPTYDGSELADDFNDSLDYSLRERAQRLLRQIEANELPVRYAWKNDNHISDSYALREGYATNYEEWWLSIEVDFPSEAHWTIKATVNIALAVSDAVKELIRGYGRGIDPKDIVKVFHTPAVQQHVKGIWAGIVSDLNDEGPAKHDRFPISRGMGKPMQDAWWSQAHDKVGWDDDAPFNEFPVEHSIVRKWRLTRTIKATSKGFDVSYVAKVEVDIAWPGDSRLKRLDF